MTPPTPSPTPPTLTFGVQELVLVDADTNADIPGAFDCTPNACLGSAEFFSIRAVTVGSVGSVILTMKGPIEKKQLEGVEPWALFGDIAGDFMGSPLQEGDYVVTAQAFSEADGKGEASEVFSVSFSTFPNVPTVTSVDPAPAPILPPTILPTPAPTTLPPVLPGSSAIFINFGGDDYLDEATGIVWEAGAPFTKGGSSYSTDAEIKDTLLDPLYQVRCTSGNAMKIV